MRTAGGCPFFLEKTMFAVGTILYGDYPQLANRLLKSISNLPCNQLLIGLNAISIETRLVLQDWLDTEIQARSIQLIEEVKGTNVGKYPLMRKIVDRVTQPLFMWFDDDSYLNITEPEPVTQWLGLVENQMRPDTQLGSIHKIRQRNKQYLVIPLQPWYTGLTVTPKHSFTFATGGWWTIHSDFLHKWKYPFDDLHHNGGDSILGELIRQQGKRLVNFAQANCRCESCVSRNKPIVAGVMINEGGRKGRRGIGVSNEYYIWSSGNPNSVKLPSYDYSIRKVK